jgi:hypothetical protein
VNASFDTAAPLSQANVMVRLKDGRTLVERVDGARGYPGRVTQEELGSKFIACARRVLGEKEAVQALEVVRSVESLRRISELTEAISV